MSKKIYLCTNNFYTLLGTVSNKTYNKLIIKQLHTEKLSKNQLILTIYQKLLVSLQSPILGCCLMDFGKI